MIRKSNNKFLILVLTSTAMLSACVESIPKLPIAIGSFGPTATDLEGTWSGSYVCGQGETAVRLQLKSSGPQSLVGRYDFFSLPGRSNSEAGSFTVAGTVNRGQISLKPTQWIVRPPRYNAVSVLATAFSKPDRLIGNITESGCGRFEVKRNP